MEYLTPDRAAEFDTAAPVFSHSQPDSEKVVAVIVAAGRSTRMAGLDKQFALAGGRPLLAYSAAVFEQSPLISEFVIVLSPENLERGKELAAAEGWTKLRGFAEGGARRQDSVYNGLLAFADADGSGPDWVMIHDGARPFVTDKILADGLEAARETGACVAAVPVKDTIKRVDRASLLVEETPPRELLWAIQTPQVFRYDLICEAHRQCQASGADVTDDAMMAEMAGHPVKVYKAAYTNIKVTTPDDLDQARLILAGVEATANPTTTETAPISPAGQPESVSEQPKKGAGTLPNVRIGQGFDVHRLVEGRPLILGGVTIPFELGLDGHSDADVLTHAIINALLGAAGMGDIGRHYPPTDPTLKGISSLQMLTELYARIQAEGWQLINLDATVVAQKPKLSPYVPEIQKTLAGVLGVEESRINVKATTTEKLGFAGRMEGLEGQAVALLGRG